MSGCSLGNAEGSRQALIHVAQSQAHERASEIIYDFLRGGYLWEVWIGWVVQYTPFTLYLCSREYSQIYGCVYYYYLSILVRV